MIRAYFTLRLVLWGLYQLCDFRGLLLFRPEIFRDKLSFVYLALRDLLSKVHCCLGLFCHELPLDGRLVSWYFPNYLI